jgi:hypothetical protein
MPAIKCVCGERLSYGTIPNPIEWLAINDVEFEQYREPIDLEDLYKNMKSILRCGNCGRLWAFWDGLNAPPSSYTLEL